MCALNCSERRAAGFFYFSLAFFVVAMVVNTIFLYYPILGAPKSSIMGWLNDWHGRPIALCAGIICGLGNTCVHA